MRLPSSSKYFVRCALPFLTTVAIAGAGVWISNPQSLAGDPVAAGLASVLLTRARVLVPIVVGLAVGWSVWLLQKSNARQRELKAANRTLMQVNEQRKQEVQNFIQSDQRSQLLFLSNPCPILILDCQSMAITEANDAALRLYGYTRDDFLRLNGLDIRPPEEHERFKSCLQQSDSGYGHRGIWTHRRKDGSNFAVEIRAFRFVHDGAVLELVQIQDVSARVQTEEALLRSQAALKSMVDNAPFGVCGISLKGDCILGFNPALAGMLGGYSREEMLTMKLSTQLYHDPADYERMVELLRRARQLKAFEAALVRKDGNTIRVRTWGVLKRNSEDDADLVDLYIEDITEHSTLEQQVRQVQKLEAVGRLAGGVAHDFNNILVVIRLSTELMLGKVTLESPLSKPLLQVLNASDRAASLTRQLLAFGRLQVMQTRTINLNTVVTDTMRLLRRTIGEDIELITRLDAQLHNARLDPDQLAQVIMNLAINSRDAMPAGGTLEIETCNVELDQTYALEHGPVQPGRYVMLVVSDSGSGIDSAILPRIFDPFFTTKDLGKGTGLGLSIVYGIVKQSGGYVWVYSEAGHGTTFKLYFPITDSHPEHEPERAEPQAMTGDKRILVVEDEAQIRQNLCECLRQLGCHVIEAADGLEAIERFKEQQGKIDLVLTDLVMPRMSGHELWTQLIHLDPQLSFLFMSGYTEDSAMRREILSRQSAFLNKPFTVADLSNAIQRALAMRRLQHNCMAAE
jgi:two-component system, cell cycle sensor histidine kinase and response regulator CckA